MKRRYLDPYGIVYPTIVVNGSGEWHPWSIPEECVKLPPTSRQTRKKMRTVWAPKRDEYAPHVWGHDKDPWATWKVHTIKNAKPGGDVFHVEGLCNGQKLGQLCATNYYKVVVLTGYAWPPEFLKWIKEKLRLKIWLETPNLKRELVDAESDEMTYYNEYDPFVEGYVITDDGSENLVVKVKERLLYRGVKNRRIIVQCAREGREQKALLRFVRDAQLGGVWAIKEGMKTRGWYNRITIK